MRKDDQNDDQQDIGYDSFAFVNCHPFLTTPVNKSY
ncbi:hypothetical protein SAMN05421821_104136 [Mucilaginibacter lappiensis]|uniref:Uncharacterized protein n=1 Tax=Mucilaginibacter lappiensis TaxID=354630 RepID=A0A1N6WXM8_9SPHI|nr:hypothetical protein [Mucilaginibacter lappiensis]MBB6127689.1 hypothetical protein [Mucilaginibacter lappiensis]SIQ94842.1 hypothetical protein SAMN05421821_104136 [Mucilaginibacter lappiensis]